MIRKWNDHAAISQLLQRDGDSWKGQEDSTVSSPPRLKFGTIVTSKTLLSYYKVYILKKSRGDQMQ